MRPALAIALAGSIMLAASAADAGDAGGDPIYPPDATLQIERNVRPDPLKVEIDPNYRYHAEASLQRLRRAIWYLVRAHDELKLANNHRATIGVPPLLLPLKQLDRIIVILDDAVHPRRHAAPHANVLTNMPDASIAVAPDSRAIVTSTPRKPLDGIERLHDGLDRPARRLRQTRPAPVVGVAPRTQTPPPVPDKGTVSLSPRPKERGRKRGQPAVVNGAGGGASFLIPGISPIPVPKGPGGNDSCPTGNCSDIPLPNIQAK